MSAVLEIDVSAAQQKDPLAFTRLVEASKNVVSSIALAILRDPAMSEEIAQDVYLDAWNGLGTLRSASSFLPWLRQLTRNRSHECLRSRTRYRKRHAHWTSDAEGVADAMANASERYIEAETCAALADALEDLPEDAREIVTLFYREGESVRHVASLLGLSESAVKKRLERGRRVLRAALLERFADAAKKTAPGAAFSAGVAGMLAMGAPSTASAAGALAPSVKIAGTGKLVAALVPLAGAVLGAAAALLGIFWEMKQHLDSAIDVRERRELEEVRRRGGVAVIAVALWMVAAVLAIPFSKGLTIAMYVVGLAAFQAALYVLFRRQVPRVLSRRPQGDVGRRKGLGWLLLGAACGWGCLAVAIYRVYGAS